MDMLKHNVAKIIQDLLTEQEGLRESDVALMWQVWRATGHVVKMGDIEVLTYDAFRDAPSVRYIIAYRMELQRNIPSLRGRKRRAASYTIRRPKSIASRPRRTPYTLR